MIQKRNETTLAYMVSLTGMTKYFLALFFFASICSQATLKPIELDTFLKQVYESHPNIKQLKLSPLIAKKDVEASLSQKNWSFSSSTNYVSQEPNDIGFQAIIQPINESVTTNQVSGLSKLLWFSGGQLDIRLSNQLNETRSSDNSSSFSTDAVSRSYYENRLSLSYYQPLWKNLGGNLFKYDTDIAKIKHNMMLLNTQESIESFLKTMALHFFEWAYLHRIHTLIEQRERLAKESLAHTTQRYKANLVDKLDILRAEASLKRAQQSLFIARSNIDAKTKEIARLSTLADLKNVYPNPELFSIKKSSPPEKLNINSLRVYKMHADQQRMNARSISFFKEQNKPEIGLKLVNSTSAYDEDFESSFNPKKDNFEVQLNYYTALGKTNQKSKLEQAKLSQRQLVNEEAVIKSQFEAQFLSLKTKLLHYIDVLELGKNQVEISKALTIEEMKHYQQGRSQLFHVIQAQDSELQEKLSYTKHALDYLAYQLELDALLDLLYPE